MVLANVILDMKKIYTSNRKSPPSIDINQFNIIENQNKYKNELSQIEINEEAPIQNIWNEVVMKCTETGKKILGTKQPNMKHNDPVLKQLSEQKQKIKNDINANNNTQSKQELRNIKKNIKQKIKENLENELKDKLQKLEETKNDSTRYFVAMREINKAKSKK